jgi:hypothetical protein
MKEEELPKVVILGLLQATRDTEHRYETALNQIASMSEGEHFSNADEMLNAKDFGVTSEFFEPVAAKIARTALFGRFKKERDEIDNAGRR